MTDRDALLRAICTDPHDIQLRLVFADWLEEHDEAERAEFIRVQYELAKPEHQPDAEGFYPMPYTTGNLLNREDDWVRRHLWRVLRDETPSDISQEFDRWEYQPVEDGVLVTSKRDDDFDFVFRRGFVEEVHCHCRNWLAHGPAIVQAQPVLLVRLTDKRPFGDLAHERSWFIDDGTYELGADTIPGAWLGHMERGDATLATFNTVQAALDALSQAALAWAREQAELPILTWG